MHADSLPLPLPHGSRQEVEVAVPWPNEMFYYALAAWDGAGNRGRISNTVRVLIHEETTTPPPATTTPASSTLDPYIILQYLKVRTSH